MKCEKCDRKFDSARIDKHAGICKGHKIANPHEGFSIELLYSYKILPKNIKRPNKMKKKRENLNKENR